VSDFTAQLFSLLIIFKYNSLPGKNFGHLPVFFKFSQKSGRKLCEEKFLLREKSGQIVHNLLEFD
jgi:hypothetical protein